MAGYCEKCGGELGFGCLGTGTADCDLNLELKRDGVSPEHYANRVPEQADALKVRARHCEQAAAGYFYCEATPDDPCGPRQYPHDGHNGKCAA